MNFRTLCLLSTGILGLLGAGCASRTPLELESPIIHREAAPLPSGGPFRVAVLPFENESKYFRGAPLVHKVFAAQFQSSGDQVIVPEGDILKIFQQMRILPGTSPTLEQMRILANRFNAQLLITGNVLSMREDSGEHGTVNPMLILEIQLRDGRTGEVLWTTYHRRKGTDYNQVMHFGTIHTVSGLTQQMAVEIINLWNEKGLAQCNVLPRS